MKIKVIYLPELHMPPDNYFEKTNSPLKIDVEHNKVDGLWHIAVRDVQGSIVFSILSVKCASEGMYLRWLETHVERINLNGEALWKNPTIRKES